MEIYDYAETLLLSTSLEDKIRLPAEATSFRDDHPRGLKALPSFPGRPGRLSRIGQLELPKGRRLEQDQEKGKLLHFFANHELLALELMSLALLKFPDAPKKFRRGVAYTIREEQEHLRLYIERMAKMGVEFGDYPVNDYFWRSMQNMQSPLDFVVLMNLTFEQANLDYAIHYQRLFEQFEDAETANLFHRVYRDEIGHVSHGLHWFQRWKGGDPGESDWDAYFRLLPEHVSPRKAKGLGFNSEGREAVGFSQSYIRELQLYTGRRGAMPRLWIFDPNAELEQSAEKARSDKLPQITLDLEHLPCFLCRESDLLLVRRRPSQQWLSELTGLGICFPQFVSEEVSPLEVRESTIDSLHPWGYSAYISHRISPYLSRMSKRGKKTFWFRSFSDPDSCSDIFSTSYSKYFSKNFYAQWLLLHQEACRLFRDEAIVPCDPTDVQGLLSYAEEVLMRNTPVLFKPNYGASGHRFRVVRTCEELEALQSWLVQMGERQGGVIVEPLVDRLADFSVQFHIGEERIEELGLRQFLVNERFQYYGTRLGTELVGLAEEELRFLHGPQDNPGERIRTWKGLLREACSRLRDLGYRGPVGFDAFLYRDSSGHLALRALGELNGRYTMGRIALGIERQCRFTSPASWLWIRKSQLSCFGCSSFAELAKQLGERYPTVIDDHVSSSQHFRLERGIITTNDPYLATEVLTVIAIGEADENLRIMLNNRTNARPNQKVT